MDDLYGGTYRLEPEDILPDLRGEGVDVAYPLLANLHNRFLQQGLWGWTYSEGPFVLFGQEVRSHFLGHLQLLGTQELFWPWVWGPGYQLYGQDDRPNAVALRHARALADEIVVLDHVPESPWSWYTCEERKAELS